MKTKTGKARTRRLAWLKEKSLRPNGTTKILSHSKYWTEYFSECSTCGGQQSWCSGCQMWSCHGCDSYGTCMCN